MLRMCASGLRGLGCQAERPKPGCYYMVDIRYAGHGGWFPSTRLTTAMMMRGRAVLTAAVGFGLLASGCSAGARGGHVDSAAGVAGAAGTAGTAAAAGAPGTTTGSAAR